MATLQLRNPENFSGNNRNIIFKIFAAAMQYRYGYGNATNFFAKFHLDAAALNGFSFSFEHAENILGLPAVCSQKK